MRSRLNCPVSWLHVVLFQRAYATLSSEGIMHDLSDEIYA